MDLVDRFRGALVGLAVGDALGHPAEFVPSVSAIRARWGPEGVTDFEPAGRHPPGTFTDDTQMSVAVARALVRAGTGDRERLLRVMGEELAAWARSSHNNRAPGGTCLAACRNLARRVPWREAGVKGSKGNGAAVRAAPVGLYLHDDDDALVRIAASQSALTHAHPTAVAAGVAAASLVAWAARGGGLEGMVEFAKARVGSITVELLIDVGCSAALVEHVGAREMLAALDRAASASLIESDNVCELLGNGWVGDEAVACALWCVLRGRGDFRGAALRAVNSAGDSDSIACIAGSVVGAMVGIQGVPARWAAAVEKSDVLDALARALHEASRTKAPGDVDPTTDLFGAELLGVRPEDEVGGEDTEVDMMPEALRSFRVPTGQHPPAGRK